MLLTKPENEVPLMRCLLGLLAVAVMICLYVLYHIPPVLIGG